jgi:subfamily B ATP-binding cassette protein HlyB/CyaB
MERGNVVESGRHEELVGLSNGIYAHLHALQAGKSSREESA